MESRQKLAVCVSTSNPSSSLTAGGGGGSVVVLCPHTGSILSSLRATGDNASRHALGMSSLSLFPRNGLGGGISIPQLVLAYGGTPSKRDDTYGMLLSLRSAASAPLMHWKCRLPETQLSAGLIVSPCGSYVVGGGSSGVCHVWKALGGNLLGTVKAHYRSVGAMAWSDCGSYLVTGGADGMVHAFSLLDLVDYDTSVTVAPVRTWTVHHLPVTALLTLASGRVVSASQDGQIVILELFSEKVIAKIDMSQAISSLAFHGGRLYAGSIQGNICCLDLDVYAMHQTARLGVTVKRRHADRTQEEALFSIDSSESYKSELRGHEKSVTSLAVVDDCDQVLLVSGDAAGVVRVWDLKSRGCIRVIRPWSHSVSAATSVSAPAPGSGKAASLPKVASHPVTAISVVSQSDSVEQQQSSLGDFTTAPSKEKKGKTSAINLYSPLQRYSDRAGSDDAGWISIPILRPNGNCASVGLNSPSSEIFVGRGKRPRISESELKEASANSTETAKVAQGDLHVDNTERGGKELDEQEVGRLQQDLAKAKLTIQRWESVNNQLLAKLKEQQADHSA